MSINSKTIRLFISSTFSDFEDERDILHGEIFPRLQDLCSSCGFTFQPVDLRWGISQDSAEEQKTLQVCLREVQRSIEVSPLPNFLILLGDRYGWQPLPSQIPQEEFEKILVSLSNANAQSAQKDKPEFSLLKQWYKLDNNEVPPAYFLQPRRGISAKAWEELEVRMRQAFRRATTDLNLGEHAWMRYHLSATAFEISEAVFEGATKQTHDIREHVFCFHRQRLAQIPSQTYVPDPRYDDLLGDSIDNDSTVLRQKFQGHLREALGLNYLTYPAFVSDGKLTNNHLGAFANDVYFLLENVIRKQLLESSTRSPLAQEIEVHQNFLSARALDFVGRNEQVQKIMDTATTGMPNYWVLHGRGGSGKTSLMALLADKLTKGGNRVCCRFLGLSAASSSGISLLESLSRELALICDETPKTKVRGFEGWRNEFKRLLYAASKTSSQPLYVLIDALDQLPAEDPARALEWIPDTSQINISFLISTTPGAMLTTISTRLPDATFVSVSDVDIADGEVLLRHQLLAYGRSLQQTQLEYVLERFSNDPTPLYLRLAGEEVRYWLATYVDYLGEQEFPKDTKNMIHRVLDRIASPGHHGKRLVAATMSFLVAARYGLTEAELMNLLSLDSEVMAAARNATPKGRNISKLPFIYWSRLRDELLPYLTERDADGQAAIGFFHRIFYESVQKKYLATAKSRHAVHGALADYFISQSNFHDAESKQPNRRKLAELAYHLLRAERYEALLELLLEREYFDAKLLTGHQSELLSEYREVFYRLTETKHIKQALKAANALANHLLLTARYYPNRIDIEDIHAELGFHRDSRFYSNVLKEGIRIGLEVFGKYKSVIRLILGMQAREANIWRRNGKLKAAKIRLEEILPQIKQICPPSEVARIEYDLGYIAYLEGNFATSIPLIESSALSSQRDRNSVGYWISRCVAGHQSWLLGIRSGNGTVANQTFRKILNQAMKVFEKKKHVDSTSARWVMNVYSHRFSIAYRANAASEALSLAQLLRQDPWLAKFSDDLVYLRLDARMDMLNEDFVNASNKFSRYVKERRSQSLREESLAEDYLDLGLAYLRCGEKIKANTAWHEGISLPKNAGNGYWQAVIREQIGI